MATENNTPWRDADTLDRLYNDEGLNQTEIAEELGCQQTTVSSWMQKHGIESRSRSAWKTKHPQLWEDGWLKREYEEKERTAPDIADEIGCSETAVLYAVEQQGIPKHSQAILAKSDHPSFDWQRGYHRATSHNYEDGEMHSSDTIRIHRLVAVFKYGFGALDGKVVHHKNGVKWDNRPCNLEIMTQSEHMRVHAEEDI